jgi:hypothetical protein
MASKREFDEVMDPLKDLRQHGIIRMVDRDITLGAF